MFINEIEHIVGLSKKSIRYYEEEGLINPKRNDENDYRIYGDEEIKKLKVIKFLRSLDVPIRELKLLNEGKMSLEECMRDRIHKITETEENYSKVKNMCMDIIKKKDTFENIDITKYLEEINVLRKEGFTMEKVKSNKSKKIFGAVVSSTVFSIFFIFLVGMISYFQITETEKIPWTIYFILMFIFLIPVLGIVVNLVKRIIEINRGEEDEASKY